MIKKATVPCKVDSDSDSENAEDQYPGGDTAANVKHYSPLFSSDSESEAESWSLSHQRHKGSHEKRQSHLRKASLGNDITRDLMWQLWCKLTVSSSYHADTPTVVYLVAQSACNRFNYCCYSRLWGESVKTQIPDYRLSVNSHDTRSTSLQAGFYQSPLSWSSQLVWLDI